MALEADALLYLRAVVESGSLHAAARELMVAPSALSRQVRLLEREVGTALFERRPRGMAATAAGLLLYDFAQRSHDDAQTLKRQIRSGEQSLAGDFHIACVEGVLPYLLTWTSRLRAKHPQVRFHVDSMASTEVATAVASGRADVGYAFGRAARTDLRLLGSLPMPIQLALPAGHRLADARSVSLGDLEGQTFAMPHPSFGIRREVDRACAAGGLDLAIAFETNSMAFALRLVERGEAVSFSTQAMLLSSSPAPSVVLVPVRSRWLTTTEITLLANSTTGSAVTNRLRQDLVRELERSASEAVTPPSG